MKKTNLEIFIKIGNDAASGKICNACGLEFKKKTDKERLCKKCKKEQEEFYK